MIKLIAEIGSVHDGSFGNAQCLIDAVSNSGAWAVKFQHHIADEETTDYAPNPSYFSEESRKDYFNRIAFSKHQWEMLYKQAKSKSLKFIVSPFSVKSLYELAESGIDIVKIASGEVTNTELLKEVRLLKINTILSSGMSTIEELEIARDILGDYLLTVMQCTSEYPCKPRNVGLNNISMFGERFKTSRGFSDHTIGSVASILAVGEGAEYIEKHVTFSNKMYGSDAKHSMEISEFPSFVRDVQLAHEMIHAKQDKDKSAETLSAMKRTFEKSFVYTKDLKIGHKIGKADLALKKPGNGLSSKNLEEILGAELLRPVKYDEQVKLVDIKVQS